MQKVDVVVLRRSSLNLLRHLAALVVTGAAVVTTLASTGCGIDDSAFVDVAVQPRVILDGTIELSDRSAGRVVIDEVIAHAPTARLRAAVAGDVGDVVVGDGVVGADDPLLFRYALADRTGFGEALGGPRTWSVPAAGAALDVGFSPISAASANALAAGLSDSAGSADAEAGGFDEDAVVLDDLGGHTVIIHGTIAIEADVDNDFGGFGDVDPDGGAADPGDDFAHDVDPDGTPADPDPESDVDPADVDPDGGAAQPDPSDVDPDGGAAQPDPSDADPADVDPADVDPDGGAAQPDPSDVDPADVDPDGGAARNGGDLNDVDPDGTPADVDPDGTPARSLEINRGKGRAQQKKAQATAQGFGRRAIINVPFSLVIDDSFRREVVLGEDDLASVGCGDMLPIDLHLSAGELLDGDRLQQLEEIARAAIATDDETPTVTLSISGAATTTVAEVKVNGGIRQPVIAESSTKIHVSGLRR